MLMDKADVRVTQMPRPVPDGMKEDALAYMPVLHHL
jgi:hypothetical protein